ncbi:MAG: diacylglycerol kinase family protein [Oscillospiraceae bacterium]|nr:diacylglycerol kinase family protein [Oscillospiraceae bacterium]
MISLLKRFFRSMGYAFKGIKLGIKEERNLRIDMVAMLFVWFHMQFFYFTRAETAIIVLVTFLIPAFELMNTAVERAVHKPDAEHWMPAGDAKDTAAGAVLIMTIGVVVIAGIMFFDIHGLSNVLGYYTENILHPLGLAMYITASYFFITIDNFNKKEK